MRYVFYSETLLFCIDLRIQKLLYSLCSPYIIRETFLRLTNSDILRINAVHCKIGKFDKFVLNYFGVNSRNILSDSDKLSERYYNDIKNAMNSNYQQVSNSKELATLHVIVPQYENLVKVVVPHKRDLGAISNYRVTIFALLKQLYQDGKIDISTLTSIMKCFVFSQKKINSYFGDFNYDTDCKELLSITKVRIL